MMLSGGGFRAVLSTMQGMMLSTLRFRYTEPAFGARGAGWNESGPDRRVEPIEAARDGGMGFQP